ncbi:MAG: hypothetical protein QT05_C0034G0024 [archaeon GW2011_AR13]|nr:MAG: hypothetical protein QT05_C0034G0024 [archaeon GW2011_AR13]HIG94763.1 hypothetical protein [Nanoarchaeota archaeon]HIH63729.1 hypothetical protein [Nanoarchaeota archaeon]HIJ09602.1 hypothetical protein [Nanoarchaeota archaeon]
MKRGNILIENIIFIVLNLIFLSILIAFLGIKSADVSPLEEKLAKEIALIIDGAKPGMKITYNLKDVLENADENYDGKIISIDKNIVTVRLHEKGGYSYSFFSDVDVSPLYFYNDGKTNFYEITVGEKK